MGVVVRPGIDEHAIARSPAQQHPPGTAGERLGEGGKLDRPAIESPEILLHLSEQGGTGLAGSETLEVHLVLPHLRRSSPTGAAPVAPCRRLGRRRVARDQRRAARRHDREDLWVLSQDRLSGVRQRSRDRTVSQGLHRRPKPLADGSAVHRRGGHRHDLPGPRGHRRHLRRLCAEWPLGRPRRHPGHVCPFGALDDRFRRAAQALSRQPLSARIFARHRGRRRGSAPRHRYHDRDQRHRGLAHCGHCRRNFVRDPEVAREAEVGAVSVGALLGVTGYVWLHPAWL